MVKRRRAVSSNEARKGSDGCSSIDRISMLPDEILGFILSHLTYNEAIATSILSHRWRYLWTLVPRLNFDGTESLLKVAVDENLALALDKKSWDFIRWVDQALALRKNSSIEEFRVFFNLDKTHGRWIDKWLEHAFARKVQRLELNLTKDAPLPSHSYDEFYTFPHNFFCGSVDFKFLKTISMNMVNVNGEALEFFLHNSPLLEELSVSGSIDLFTLKIVGPPPSFKRLELDMCHNLNSIEIRDSNLVHLKYHGKRIHFVLENAPFLVSFSIGGLITDRMQKVLFLFSSILPQLETFEIHTNKQSSWRDTKMLYSAVKMSNLKQLVVRVGNHNGESLLPLTNFVRASPCLQRFVVEASCGVPKFSKRKANKIVRPYPQLKEVEFVGYDGGTCDLELVMHLLENATNLDKIIINLCFPVYNSYLQLLFKEEIIEDQNVARARATKQLRDVVPGRIKLEFIGEQKQDASLLPPTNKLKKPPVIKINKIRH